MDSRPTQDLNGAPLLRQKRQRFSFVILFIGILVFGGAGKADRAVARGDLDMPADAQSVAILRKNVVVLWSPSGLPAKGSKKTPTPKIKSLDDLQGHRIGVIGKTDANVTLLRIILSESGIADDKVTLVQFAINQIGEMARDR